MKGNTNDFLNKQMLMNDIPDEKFSILQELRRQRRLRLATNLVIEVTHPIISGKFINIPDVDLEVDYQMAQLPLGLLQFIAQNTGSIEIWNHNSNYNPRERLAQIRLLHLAQRAGVLHEEVLHLADHLLGSLGDTMNPLRMSQGYGISEGVRKIGERIRALYLRQSDFRDLSASDNEREYFARAGRWYLLDAAFLEEADAEIYKVLQETIFSETFWKEVVLP
jgi:hypothetical protein